MNTIRDLDLKGKRVLVRVDFNVPMDGDKNITDDIRIRMALPTINHILDQGGKLILCSHMGRPGGKRVMDFSLAPAASILATILDRPVLLAPDCIGEESEALVAAMQPGDVVMLENLRFHKEETGNDAAFAEKIARMARCLYKRCLCCLSSGSCLCCRSSGLCS